MNYSDFEKLDIYQPSIEIVVLIDKITESLPPGRAFLTNQKQQSGASISLNIAVTPPEFSVNKNNGFYRMAKLSAIESAATFVMVKRLNNMSTSG